MSKLGKLQIDGVEYKTKLTARWENRKNWERPNPKMILTHLPGTVLQFNVKEGDQVKEGDVLLLLQAMKMENKITAPLNGIVKKIHVTTGDRIPKGTLMIELD